MNNDFIELKREVDTEISNLLVKFIDLYRVNGLSPYVASVYYRFILASFKVARKERYSISTLSIIFNKNKLPTNLLVNIYAHSLYCLALYDKQKIYEEFII